MFERDSHVRSRALTMWANYIETGDVTLSRHDARGDGRPRVLTDDQQRFVLRLRDLAKTELSS